MSDLTTVENGERSAETRSDSDSALTRREVLAAVTATTVGSGAFAGQADAGSDGAHWDIEALPDDLAVAQEEVFVETTVDSNDSGEPDRIYVDVIRPAESEPVPVIMLASPYNGEQTHSDSTPEMLYDRRVQPSADIEGDDGTAGETAGAGTGSGHRGRSGGVRLPGRNEARYLQQGYAIARASSLGTHRSTGCYTAAGPETITALEAVVDWFNGRATAYASRTGTEEVTADWASGKTGMTGVSAVGELANGVATTGVDGLEAIVAQSANAGQYSLFRANGTPVSVVPDGDEGMVDLGTWVQAGTALRPACDHWVDRVEAGQDRATGDYNDFWHEREMLPEADSVEAGVLLSHGVNDPIVRPNHFAQWYEALVASGVPVRLWVHQGGHGPPQADEWEALTRRWWDYWLRGEDNGVLDQDPVTVTHDGPSFEGGPRKTYESWPIPDTEPVSVAFEPGGRTVGGLVAGGETTGATADGTATGTRPESDEETFVDDPSTPVTALAGAAESQHRLRYRTPPLGEPVHVNGRVVPSLSLSFDDPTVVSAALVEYAPGGSTVVTRGWADPLNRPRYSGFDSPVAYKQSLRESAPLDPGERVTVEFPLQATDHVFDADSRLGVVVYASDKHYTLYPPGNAEATLSLADSSVAIPVVGGRSALTGAFRAESTAAGGGTDTGTGPAEPGTGPPATRTDRTGTVDDPPDTGIDTTLVPARGSDSGSEGTVEDGPGFGIGSVLAALGGITYGLKRRTTDENTDSK